MPNQKDEIINELTSLLRNDPPDAGWFLSGSKEDLKGRLEMHCSFDKNSQAFNEAIDIIWGKLLRAKVVI